MLVRSLLGGLRPRAAEGVKGTLTMGIRISGIGAYVPQGVVTNDELTRRLDTSNEWIVNKTGIRERRIAAADEAPSDMGTFAALQCLSNARLE